jgi:hypothetical protein
MTTTAIAAKNKTRRSCVSVNQPDSLAMFLKANHLPLNCARETTYKSSKIARSKV